jgi:hypothetical protein
MLVVVDVIDRDERLRDAVTDRALHGHRRPIGQAPAGVRDIERLFVDGNLADDHVEERHDDVQAGVQHARRAAERRHDVDLPARHDQDDRHDHQEDQRERERHGRIVAAARV